MAIRSIYSRSFSLIHSLLRFSNPHKPKTHLLISSPISHPFTTTPTSPPNPNSNPNPSPQSVNDLCRILSDFRNPHDDIESALNPFTPKISTNLIEQVLKRCKNLGFPAHRFFVWARNLPGFRHSNDSYRILIDGLGSSKQFPLIWDFVLEMKDMGDHEIGRDIFWVIFRAYARANLPVDAIRAFHLMVEFGINPSMNDVDYLLFVLCKRKLVRHAHEFFDKIKAEFEPGAKSYSILIRGWGDLGECGEARKVFDEMLERGCVLDVVAYNSLLESLCRGGSADEAYKLFREMGSKGLKPNACSFSIFIRSYCDSNDVHSALRVLDRMSRYELVPNVYTYNCIIKKLCKNDKVDEAYELLDEMIKKGVTPDEWSYNAIEAYHCDHNEVNKALRLIFRMERSMCMPDRHTYNMVLKMLIRVGRFDRVSELWQSMDEGGFYAPVSTYAVMIHGLCKKNGQLETACRYFEMMIDDGLPPYSTTCEMLRNRLIGLGFSEQVYILADKMERSTSCAIQELSKAMRGDKVDEGLKDEEHSWIEKYE